MPNRTNYGEYVKDRVYRVIINYSNGDSCGAGFFISKTKFLTCFHVVFGTELRNIRIDPQFVALPEDNEHKKLEAYLVQKSPSFLIELHDGTRISGRLKKFSEFYDIALLEIESSDKVNICKIDKNAKINYGDVLSFGGFPNQYGYNHDNTPFAYTEGIVSSFPSTVVGGDNYDHIKINAINLSGNSGAPLFIKDQKKVVGVINGNMNWGRDDLLSTGNITNGQMTFQPASLRVPLSIAYATSLKSIQLNTDIL